MSNPLKFIFLVVLFSLLITGTSFAQGFSSYIAEKGRPKTTEPYYISMMFFKLSGTIPDFKNLAENTKRYQESSRLDRLNVLDQEVQELKNIYSLITMQEPIIIELPVRLSEYSKNNKGFFIESFTENMFFPIESNGQNYALVPNGLMDKQWLKVTNKETADTIEAANNVENGKPLIMTLYLTPVYADSSVPANIEGKNYWLMSVNIKDMELYLPDASSSIWKFSGLESNKDSQTLQKLLNLR